MATRKRRVVSESSSDEDRADTTPAAQAGAADSSSSDDGIVSPVGRLAARRAAETRSSQLGPSQDAAADRDTLAARDEAAGAKAGKHKRKHKKQKKDKRKGDASDGADDGGHGKKERHSKRRKRPRVDASDDEGGAAAPLAEATVEKMGQSKALRKLKVLRQAYSHGKDADDALAADENSDGGRKSKRGKKRSLIKTREKETRQEARVRAARDKMVYGLARKSSKPSTKSRLESSSSEEGGDAAVGAGEDLDADIDGFIVDEDEAEPDALGGDVSSASDSDETGHRKGGGGGAGAGAGAAVSRRSSKSRPAKPKRTAKRREATETSDGSDSDNFADSAMGHAAFNLQRELGESTSKELVKRVRRSGTGDSGSESSAEEPDPEWVELETEMAEEDKSFLGALGVGMRRSRSLRVAFAGYMHYLVFALVDPTFTRRMRAYRADEMPLYYLQCVKQIQEDANVSLKNCGESQVWRWAKRDLQKNIYELPFVSVETLDEYEGLDKCEACNRSKHPARTRITLSGVPYNAHQLNRDGESEWDEYLPSRNIAEKRADYIVGSACCARIQLYSEMLHFKIRTLLAISDMLRRQIPEHIVQDTLQRETPDEAAGGAGGAAGARGRAAARDPDEEYSQSESEDGVPVSQLASLSRIIDARRNKSRSRAARGAGGAAARSRKGVRRRKATAVLSSDGSSSDSDGERSRAPDAGEVAASGTSAPCFTNDVLLRATTQLLKGSGQEDWEKLIKRCQVDHRRLIAIAKVEYGGREMKRHPDSDARLRDAGLLDASEDVHLFQQGLIESAHVQRLTSYVESESESESDGGSESSEDGNSMDTDDFFASDESDAASPKRSARPAGKAPKGLVFQ